MASSRGSSQPREQTCVFELTGRFFTTELPGKPLIGYTPIQNEKFVFCFFFKDSCLNEGSGNLPVPKETEELTEVL